MRILRAVSAVIVTLSLLLSTSVPVSAHERQYFSQGTNTDDWGEWQVQYPETYDGDGIIAASVHDMFTDGSCVWAVYRDGDRIHHQARSCWRWTDHLFYDQTGDSDAWVRLRRTRHSDQERWKHISGY